MAQISAAARTAMVGVGYRTVFIKVQPAPVKLAERRAILRMLQRFGVVEMFKKLSDNNSFLSIMKTVAAATDISQRSPITYDLITEKSEGLSTLSAGAINDITASVRPIPTVSQLEPRIVVLDETEDSKNDGQDEDANFEENDAADGDAASGAGSKTSMTKHKSFVLHAFYAKNYPHHAQIAQSPLYGPWPSEPHAENSFVFGALRDVVPLGRETKGLCDWTSGSQLSDEARILRYKHKDDAENRVSAQAYFRERDGRRLRKEGTGLGQNESQSPTSQPQVPAGEEDAETLQRLMEASQRNSVGKWGQKYTPSTPPPRAGSEPGISSSLKTYRRLFDAQGNDFHR